MSGFWLWSTTASANGSADPTINMAEGMSPSSVNNSCRSIMARLAEYRDDISGVLVTGGTSVAYTITTQEGVPTTPNDGQAICIRPHVTNGAAPTLTVDGGNTYPILIGAAVAAPAAALTATAPYIFVFSSVNSAWMLHGYYNITINLDQFGNTQGDILYRNASSWTVLAPGTAGTFLQSNGAAADPSWAAPTSVVIPQGYLTPVSGQPIITADSIGATSIYYAPYLGNLAPIYNGSIFVNTAFTQLQLDLSAGSQSAGGIYDVFLFLDTGTPTIAFGPSWAAGGGSVTAGSCARGTGAGSTELQRVNGILTNKNSISAANNGATTYAIAANEGTYLGSVYISGSAGQVTNHVGYGQSRVRGLWNAWNRQPFLLKAGDGTASWAYSTATFRPSNNSTANSLTVFSGLAEEPYQFDFKQAIVGGNAGTFNGIGWNSTTAASGKIGTAGAALNGSAGELSAIYIVPPAIGINVITGLEKGSTGASFDGTETNMQLIARWRG